MDRIISNPNIFAPHQWLALSLLSRSFSLHLAPPWQHKLRSGTIKTKNNKTCELSFNPKTQDKPSDTFPTQTKTNISTTNKTFHEIRTNRGNFFENVNEIKIPIDRSTAAYCYRSKKIPHADNLSLLVCNTSLYGNVILDFCSGTRGRRQRREAPAGRHAPAARFGPHQPEEAGGHDLLHPGPH